MNIFKRKQQITANNTPILTNKPIKYPKWSYVHNIETDEFFLILEKTKKKFISLKAFNSWSVVPIRANTNNLSYHLLDGKIGFRPGTLIKCISEEPIYLVDSGNLIHQINTPEVFEIGFNYHTCFLISKEELDFHEKGDPINSVFL